MKKGIIKIITLLLILALPIAFMAGCDSSLQQEKDYAHALISVKINPEVELAINEEGKVEGVYYVNEDAEVLLSQTDLIGMDAEDAVETIVDEATEAGYIDVEGQENEVEIGVITEEDEEDTPIQKQIQNRLRERIHKYFDNNGIFGVVSEATLEAYAEQAAELGVSTGKTKMILRALELDPLLDINELKDLPMNELARGLSQRVKNKANIATSLREEFLEDREAVLAKYPEKDILEQEIKTIKEQLEGYEGTEEERAILEASLETKETELQALLEQIEEEIEQLHQEYKAETQQIREQQREEAQQRKEANRQRVQEHRENVSKERVEQVQQWRKNKK
ncbi:MAG: anti-sigma-I factor RsgI family protein [Christensenellales bacterium]|jgi:hypothetical protein